MRVKPWLRIGMVLAGAAALSAGCKAPPEHAGLARAGTAYAAAMDSLLAAVGPIAVDATSERLLQDDALANQSLENYRNLSAGDEELLGVLGRLRGHVRLLSRYFGLLEELATTDAPERVKQAIGDEKSGVVGALAAAGAELRGSRVIPEGISAAAGPIARLTVGGMIRGALRDELAARQETIRRELLLQEDLLRALSGRIRHDLAGTKQAREQRLVIEPLTAEKPISNPDTWAARRRAVLALELSCGPLDTAGDDVQALRGAFEDLVSGRLTLERVNSLLADFSALLGIAEKLKG